MPMAIAAAGGGKILLIVNSGATYSWRPATGRWLPLGALTARSGEAAGFMIGPSADAE